MFKHSTLSGKKRKNKLKTPLTSNKIRAGFTPKPPWEKLFSLCILTRKNTEGHVHVRRLGLHIDLNARKVGTVLCTTYTLNTNTHFYYRQNEFFSPLTLSG